MDGTTHYLNYANSPLMLVFCAVPIGFVCFYTATMAREAYKEARNLGMERADLWKMVKASAVFSVVPSLSIWLFYLLFAQQAGKYFSWLRVSIIGNGNFPLLVRSYAIPQFGAPSWDEVTINMFTVVMLSQLVGITIWLVSSALITRPYDWALKNAKRKAGGGFAAYMSAALLAGMLSRMVMPYIVIAPRAPYGCVALVSGMCMSYITQKLGRTHAWARTHSFTISLVFAMAVCIIVHQLRII